MRFIVGCVAALALVFMWHVSVSASESRLRQTHVIEIEVECLETAADIIRELNGYNLDSSVSFTEMPLVNDPWGWRVRQANYTRRVERWAFRHVQEVLRSLGDVVFETERAQNLDAELNDIEVRLASVLREIERLSIMMAASGSLEVLIAIDGRMSQLAWERDWLIGRRNVLLSQAASPVINIIVTEIPEDFVPPTPPSFASRVGDAFMGSLRGMRNGVGNFLVFLARVSIPAAIWIVIVGALGLVTFRVSKRVLARGHSPLAVGAGAGTLSMDDSPIEGVPHEKSGETSASDEPKEGDLS